MAYKVDTSWLVWPCGSILLHRASSFCSVWSLTKTGDSFFIHITFANDQPKNSLENLVLFTTILFLQWSQMQLGAQSLKCIYLGTRKKTLKPWHPSSIYSWFIKIRFLLHLGLKLYSTLNSNFCLKQFILFSLLCWATF